MKTATQLRNGAFTEQLWRSWHKEVRRYIESRVSDRDEAEDILQETFIDVYTGQVPVNGGETVWNFLRRAALNAAFRIKTMTDRPLYTLASA